MTIIHHDEIRRRIKPRYTAANVQELEAFLQRRGTLTFTPLPTGLFPAVPHAASGARPSGYGSVWVRDNVFVALAHLTAGKTRVAAAVLEGLAAFYGKYRHRLEAVIDGTADPARPMERPHVRFDGVALTELDERWSHAQNDALGYFLWLYCDFVERRELARNDALLTLFARYFEAVRYWEDEDSGHWEERRKVGASSVGAAVAGLRALHRLLESDGTSVLRYGDRNVTIDLVSELVGRGERVLEAVLPRECTQADPKKRRDHDAALLFLIYPLAVVDDALSVRIVDDVVQHLQGDHGIRRYLSDSYWTADFKERWSEEVHTTDPDRLLDARDALARPGEEAQWSLFDPIVSIISGRSYLRTGNAGDRERQVHHLNRALGQLTGSDSPHCDLRCPEAWYLERGRYVPNDNVPLLWTQANLWLALRTMYESATRNA